MNILATFQNDLWKFTDVRALTVIFHVRSWKMQKNFFLRLWKNPELIFINMFRPTYMPNLATLARKTRTTRAPAFWGYPPPPHGYPHYWVILDPKSKKLLISNWKRYRADTIFKVKVELPCRYRSRSKVITCDTPSHASDHLYQIWKESIQNCRRYKADTIFKVKAKWPWKYRSKVKGHYMRHTLWC